ncbi:MAG: ribbon-helix-helix protein, CopG family [Gordonia sp. (in: high G+C Gram-positive bacteria)]|uniref:ribbon-helix-helix protein, CopG family n=1 Tax=Gordonia sp. (in: high G+C Gram-positive bacteria) TaxID=84139 RepID=UPI0039E263EA
MRKLPRSEAEYEALADYYAENPPVPAGPVTISLDRLKTGRPAKGRAGAGKSAAISIRFPDELREQLDRQAETERAPVAEVVRRAVIEYLDGHPV